MRSADTRFLHPNEPVGEPLAKAGAVKPVSSLTSAPGAVVSKAVRAAAPSRSPRGCPLAMPQQRLPVGGRERPEAASSPAQGPRVRPPSSVPHAEPTACSGDCAAQRHGGRRAHTLLRAQRRFLCHNRAWAACALTTSGSMSSCTGRQQRWQVSVWLSVSFSPDPVPDTRRALGRAIAPQPYGSGTGVPSSRNVCKD